MRVSARPLDIPNLSAGRSKGFPYREARVAPPHIEFAVANFYERACSSGVCPA
jgi:hypothetical protein